MKKVILPLVLGALILGGCQQVTDSVDKTMNEAEKTYQETANTIENAKKELNNTKAKVDEKINQANEAAGTVSKLVE